MLNLRNALAAHLKDLRHMDGGDRQLTSWLKEEGFQTSVRSVVQVTILSTNLLHRHPSLPCPSM